MNSFDIYEEMGSWGEELVYHDISQDSYPFTSPSYFAATLEHLGVITNRMRSTQQYFDLSFRDQCELTGDERWLFVEVKTICTRVTDLGEAFIRIDHNKLSNYERFNRVIEAAIARGEMPIDTQYELWIVSQSGVFFTSMDSAVCGEVENGFWRVTGTEFHRKLTITESDILKDYCRQSSRLARGHKKRIGRYGQV